MLAIIKFLFDLTYHYRLLIELQTFQKVRKCVPAEGSFNHFEIEGVKTNYLNMTCTKRCNPPGWFVFLEIAVTARK